MKNKIFFTIFIIIWVAIVLLNILIKNPEFSEQENRYLAKIPTFTFEGLLSGEYQQKLDTYINDHFIFRNGWLKIKSQTEMLLRKNRK